MLRKIALMRPEYKLLAGLSLGLAAWGIYHAIGAYRFNHDPRRGLIVVACMAAFLAFWWLMLLTRKPRQ